MKLVAIQRYFYLTCKYTSNIVKRVLISIKDKDFLFYDIPTSRHTGISQRLLQTISPSEHSQYWQVSEVGIGSDG